MEICAGRDIHKNVPSSIISSCQKLETTQIFINIIINQSINVNSVEYDKAVKLNKVQLHNMDSHKKY